VIRLPPALKARFPFTNASIKGPKGASDAYSTNAVGNLELNRFETMALEARRP